MNASIGFDRRLLEHDVAGSIAHEHKRQVEQWLKDGRTMSARSKSTRGWDDEKLVTVLQREKEDADEYRYFPDPDLVEVEVDAAWIAKIRARLVDPPHVLKARWSEAGVPAADAEALAGEPGLARFFASVVKAGAEARAATHSIRSASARRA